MKIRIEQSEKTEQPKGFFSRNKPATTTYFVALKVELTNEEKEIIRQYDLNEFIVGQQVSNQSYLNSPIEQYNSTPPFDTKKRETLQRQIDFFSEPTEYTVALLTDNKGFTCQHPSIREASDYTQFLKTDILPRLKQTIEQYASRRSPSSDTFEL